MSKVKADKTGKQETEKKGTALPPTKLEEADRVIVAEQLLRLNVAQNVVRVIEAKVETIKAQLEAREIELRAAAKDLNDIQQSFVQFLTKFKADRNIPTEMDINIETGALIVQRPPQTAGQPGPQMHAIPGPVK